MKPTRPISASTQVFARLLILLLLGSLGMPPVFEVHEAVSASIRAEGGACCNGHVCPCSEGQCHATPTTNSTPRRCSACPFANLQLTGCLTQPFVLPEFTSGDRKLDLQRAFLASDNFTGIYHPPETPVKAA